MFLRFRILADGAIGPAESEPNRGLGARLALKSRSKASGGPVEELAHGDVPVSRTCGGLVTDVGLAEQVFLEEVVDGLSDVPLIVSPALLGLGQGQSIGCELQPDRRSDDAAGRAQKK